MACYGLGLLIVALLPTAVAYAVYASWDAGAIWWQATVTGVVTRLSDPALTQVKNGLRLLLIVSPLIAMAGGSRGQAMGGDPRLRRFLWCWLAVVIGGIVGFGGWYDHYGLPLVVPGAAAAAGFLGGRGRRYAVPILAVAALAGQIVLGINRWRNGEPGELAAVVRAIGPGPGTLFVYSGPTLAYSETDRPVVTHYIFPSHLYLAREEGSIGVHQVDETRRIVARRPEIIVMAPAYRSEEKHIRAIVAAAVARDYRLKATLPLGRDRLAIYVRRPAS